MRTTMSLDEDVAAHLARVAKQRRQPLKAVVNAALRAGLHVLDHPGGEQPRFATTGFAMGPSLVGSLDDVEGVLARVEGEPHR